MSRVRPSKSGVLVSSFESLLLGVAIFAVATLLTALLAGGLYDVLRRWWRWRGRR